MNALEIIVLVVFVLLAAGGLRRGFVRKLASMLSLFASVALVSLLLPYMTQFLKERTPVYDYIVEQCQAMVTRSIGQGAAEGTGLFKEASLNMSREQIGALMEQYGYDSSVLDTLSDSEIAQYASDYAGGDVAQAAGNLSGMFSLSGEQQARLIRSLPLSDFLQEQLVKYNNVEGYRNLGVSTFQDYVISYLASAILNVLSFILAVALVNTAIWLVVRLLDRLVRIPGLGLLNRLAGGALGLAQGVFVLCLFFLVLSMFEATAPGQAVLRMVRESEVLNFIYSTNLFQQLVLRAAVIFV